MINFFKDILFAFRDYTWDDFDREIKPVLYVLAGIAAAIILLLAIMQLMSFMGPKDPLDFFA